MFLDLENKLNIVFISRFQICNKYCIVFDYTKIIILILSKCFCTSISSTFIIFFAMNKFDTLNLI